MESISVERREELLKGCRELLKLELRDHYQVDADMLAAWRDGGFAAIVEAARRWQDQVTADLSAGRAWRRLRVVSEPLSAYHRFAYEFARPGVEAGEDMRYLPRRLVSVVGLPGNDCFVLDHKTAMFNILDGNDVRVDILLSHDGNVVQFCADAFRAAWAMATPHQDYRPASS